MPGISISNSQEAFNMLSQIQNGKSYMVSSDGKSLQEATIGHKIRQFFGFKSAKAENQGALDLIKDTLKSDPRYTDLATRMFNGVDASKDITADVIKNAFSDFKGTMANQTQDALKNHVSTTLINLLQGENKAKIEKLIGVFGSVSQIELPENALKNFLAGRCLSHINTNGGGRPISAAELTERINFYINQAYDTCFKNANQEEVDTAREDGVNILTEQYRTFARNVLTKDEANLTKNNDINLSTLHSINSQIDSEKIDATKTASFTSINNPIVGLKNQISKLISNTSQKKFTDTIDKLQTRLTELATTKSIADKRSFEERLAADEKLQGLYADLKKHIVGVTNTLAKLMLKSADKEGDSDTISNAEKLAIASNEMNIRKSGDLDSIITSLKTVMTDVGETDKAGNVTSSYTLSVNHKRSNESEDVDAYMALDNHVNFIQQLQAVLKANEAVLEAARNA